MDDAGQAVLDVLRSLPPGYGPTIGELVVGVVGGLADVQNAVLGAVADLEAQGLVTRPQMTRSVVVLS